MNYFLNDTVNRSRFLIAMVGAGGSGSAMLNKLFQMDHILKALDMVRLDIDVYDPDVVSQANLGRQSFYQPDLGLPKSEVLVSRFTNFGDVQMSAYNEKFSSDMELRKYDLIITCTDSVSLRQELGKKCDSLKNESAFKTTLWLDTGNGKHNGQIVLGTFIDHDNNIILPCVHELYPELMQMKESNSPSCSSEEAIQKQDFGVNEKVAVEASTLLWQLLRYRQINRNGVMFDISSGFTTPIDIDLKSWEFMGLKTKRDIAEKMKQAQESTIKTLAN